MERHRDRQTQRETHTYRQTDRYTHTGTETERDTPGSRVKGKPTGSESSFDRDDPLATLSSHCPYCPPLLA
jgi:hypothetical protein